MKASEQDRPEIQAERAAFIEWIKTVDPSQVKVVDESGLVRGMRLGYGYAERGERVYDSAPAKRGKRLNMVGWMGLDGSGAVATHPGTVNGPIFRGFVHTHLLPALREGDIVIWDNHRIHQVEGLKEQIEARGAVLKPLPRYSPDLNPIEMLWSKLKHYIKKARADTEEALEQAVEAAVGLVCGADARGWFEHCGFCLQFE